MKCEICGFIINDTSRTLSCLKRHLTKRHHLNSVELKSYYDKFLKKDKEECCILCGQPDNSFINFSLGYKNKCNKHSKLSKSQLEYWLVQGYTLEKAQEEVKKYNSSKVEFYMNKFNLNKEDANKILLDTIGSKNTRTYWLRRGYTVEEADKLRRLQNKNCNEYWINKGYTKEEAIKIRRTLNKNCIDYWIDKGYKYEDAIKIIKTRNKKCKDYWLNKGYSETEAEAEVSKRSPFSVHFWLKKGMSKKNAKSKINEQIPNRYEYWISRGYTKEAAKIEISKYHYLNPNFWIRRGYTKEAANIMAAKSNPFCINNNGVSKISQQLFNDIYDKIKDYFNDIRYHSINSEKIIIMPDNYIRKYCKLDFYIPCLQLNIEFDGSWWHDVNNKLKTDDDSERDKQIKTLIPDIKILRIGEMYYINHRRACVNHIVNFILKLKNKGV